MSEIKKQFETWAKGYSGIRAGIYTLMKGSFIRANATDKFATHNQGYFQLWQKIVTSDAVEKSKFPELLTTTRDLEFRSPSAAASIVRARASNGRTEWLRSKDAKPLMECEVESSVKNPV